MADWQQQFNYAIFYRAVYHNNTNYHQYENTNILINGVRLNAVAGAPREAINQPQASRLCQGIRPIAKAKASELGGLPESELERRIKETSIIDIDAAARCLALLLVSDHINLDDTRRGELLAIPYKENAARFLAAVFRIAVACPGTMLKPHTPEVQADIETYRRMAIEELAEAHERAPLAAGMVALSSTDRDVSGDDGQQEDGGAIGLAVETPVPFAKYTCRELLYNQDKQYVKENMLVLKDCEPEKELTEAEIYACCDIFRRYTKTFELEFEGTADGFLDVMLYHMALNQCAGIAVVGKMRSKAELSKLRNPLIGCARFGLDEEGRMLFAYGYDPDMPKGQYQIRAMITFAAEGEEQTKRWQLIKNPSTYPLSTKGYGGRVPDFILPFRPKKDDDN